MTFACNIFIVAGVWGVLVLPPLFVLVDVRGRQYAPPLAYPHFFYGFLSVAMAWQIAFLWIGSDPIRFRPLMAPSILETLGHVRVLARSIPAGESPPLMRRRRGPTWCSASCSLQHS